MNEQIESFTELVDVRELSYRADGDFEVTLLWWPSEHRLLVTVVERATGALIEVPVGDRPPLEVFYHPYAYADVRLAAAA
jgi:hypothetical protein